MEKQLATAAYWAGIVSTVLALIMRGLALLGIYAFSPGVVAGRNPVSFRTFLEGAILFFVMAIASSVIAMAKDRKA